MQQWHDVAKDARRVGVAENDGGTVHAKEVELDGLDSLLLLADDLRVLHPGRGSPQPTAVMTPHTGAPAALAARAKGLRVGDFDLAHLLLGHLRAALADAERGERTSTPWACGAISSSSRSMLTTTPETLGSAKASILRRVTTTTFSHRGFLIRSCTMRPPTFPVAPSTMAEYSAFASVVTSHPAEPRTRPREPGFSGLSDFFTFFLLSHSFMMSARSPSSSQRYDVKQEIISFELYRGSPYELRDDRWDTGDGICHSIGTVACKTDSGGIQKPVTVRLEKAKCRSSDAACLWLAALLHLALSGLAHTSTLLPRDSIRHFSTNVVKSTVGRDARICGDLRYAIERGERQPAPRTYAAFLDLRGRRDHGYRR